MRDERWEKLAGIARHCPTPHNTQPFRIRPRGADEADLVCVVARLLPREDHGNLYCMSAFGMFCETLVRAGHHLGIDVEAEPARGIEPASIHTHAPQVVLGRARIRGARAAVPQPEILDVRRTSRLPYDGR